jgi:hypothetical protein
MKQTGKIISSDTSYKRISLNASLITLVLSMAASLLITVGVLFYYIHYIKGVTRGGWIYRLFLLGREWNIPTYFSVILLLSSFLLLLFIALSVKKQKSAYFPHWILLTVGFLFMAADELLSFHERLGLFMRDCLKEDIHGYFFYSWVIVAIPLIIALALFFVKFWWNLPKRSKFTFLAAAIVYLGGCVGFEMLGGNHAEKHGIFNSTYCFFETMEEGLEMFGIIIFIWGLLNHIEEHCQVELRAFFNFTKKLAQSLPFVSK